MAPTYGEARWTGALLIKGLLCACVMFMLLSVAVARPGAARWRTAYTVIKVSKVHLGFTILRRKSCGLRFLLSCISSARANRCGVLTGIIDGFADDQLRADMKFAEEAGFQRTSNEHVLNAERARELEENLIEGRELFHTDYALPNHNCKNNPGGRCR